VPSGFLNLSRIQKYHPPIKTKIPHSISMVRSFAAAGFSGGVDRISMWSCPGIVDGFGLSDQAAFGCILDKLLNRLRSSKS